MIFHLCVLAYSKTSKEMKTLFDPVIEDDDLLEICSGQFVMTQKTGKTPDTEELKEISQIQSRHRPFESSDDEADLTFENNLKKGIKTYRKPKQLKFFKSSDDEDEDDSNDKLKCCALQEEVDGKFANDLEETEVENSMKARVKAAVEYLEKEAELSESDWESEDEEEKDMDDFDIELADEEEFDQNQLHEEIVKIHARNVFTDDIRNVKMCEDLFLDGEKENQRRRKFSWRKKRTETFSLKEETSKDDGSKEVADDGESEAILRKARHERDTILNLKTLGETGNEKIVLFGTNSQVVARAEKKIRIMKTSASTESIFEVDSKTKSPFLIKAQSTQLKLNQKSSFLFRDEKTLSKIAKIVSHSYQDEEAGGSMKKTMNFISNNKFEGTKKRKIDVGDFQELKRKKQL